MIKSRLFLSAAFAYLALVLIRGIEFPLRVGAVQSVGDKLHFVTDNRTLSALIAMRSTALLECDGRSFCIMPRDPNGGATGVPVLFEPCSAQDIPRIEQCEGGTLVIRVSSASWLQLAGGKI